MTTHTFDMPSTIDAVDPMVLTMRDHASRVLSNETRFRFELCVTEVLANLVTHAAKPTAASPIKIILDLKTGLSQVEIFDPDGAEPFDVRDHAADLTDIDVMAEGGRGLALIMDCADSVAYGPTDTGHSLRLVFRDQDLQMNSGSAIDGARE